MTVLRRTVEVSKSLDDTWAFLADFANAEKWAPGVASARQATSGAIAVGTRYDLDIVFNGRTMPMTYTVTAWEPKRRVVLEGIGSRIRATDEITFEATSSGTRIGYTADRDGDRDRHAPFARRSVCRRDSGIGRHVEIGVG